MWRTTILPIFFLHFPVALEMPSDVQRLSNESSHSKQSQSLLTTMQWHRGCNCDVRSTEGGANGKLESNMEEPLTSRGGEFPNKPPLRTRAICRCRHLVRRHHVSALLTDQWGQQVRLPYGFRWSEAFSRHILRRGRPPEGGMRWKR